MHNALLVPFFFCFKEVIIIENISYEEYEKALIKKEELRKEMLDVKMQMVFNKFNEDILKELIEKEKVIKKLYAKNQVLIRTYEIENDIERGKENDQHKGK